MGMCVNIYYQGEYNMNDNEIKTQEMADENVDYINAINELKANSVSKEKYEKVKAENKQLLNSLISNEPIEGVKPAEPKPTVDELRRKLFTRDAELSNVEYVSTALDLREALLEAGEKDPFLPYGSKIVPTQEDLECAERVATVLKECVEYADGDSEVFTNELQRRTIDNAPVRPRRR